MKGRRIPLKPKRGLNGAPSILLQVLSLRPIAKNFLAPTLRYHVSRPPQRR
jgi:hypothetical protein